MNFKMRTPRLPRALLLVVLCGLTAASRAFAGGPVEVSLRFQPAQATVGTPFTAEVVFRVAKPYHIYGPDEELGIGTRVTPKPPPGIETGPVEYPPPRRVNYEAIGGELDLYEDEVVVSFPVTVPTTFDSGEALELAVLVDYQPCTDKICERPRLDEEIRGTVPVVRGAKSGGAPPAASTGSARAESPAVSTGSARTESPAASASSARAGAPAAPDAGRKPDPFRSALDAGLLWALLAAFGWGLAASLSPCVYPMIPITVSYFGGQAKSGSTFYRVTLAVTYVFGMITTYAVLGIVAARLGRDLGAWMVNPWVVGSLALVLVALACSMFGLYVLQLPPALTNRLSMGDRGGHLEALFMGLVLGFVAAPCVGPFAGSILVFVAQSGSAFVGFATLFSFGMGMGLLFIVLAVSSSAITKLPRSGMWMVKLEHFFGYVLIGMALYLISNLTSAWLATWAFGAYLVIGGTYLGAFEGLKDDAKGTSYLAKGCGLAAVVTGAAMLVAGLASGGFLGELPRGAVTTSESSSKVRWLHSLDEARAEASRTGKPIFADFYADWCIPCRLMDRTVFPDPEVVGALAGFVAVKVDCTDPDSPGARYKNEVLRSTNMPYLAVFDAAGTHLPDDSIEGYADKETLLGVLRRVAAKVGGERDG